MAPNSSPSSSIFPCSLKTSAIIILCAFFTPFCTFVAALSSAISPFTKLSKHIKHHRQWRQKSSSTFRPRTVLVTGVGPAKGLALARAFYRAGHRVVGADFEPYLVPVCGHFSSSIEIFYRLSRPSRSEGTATYIQDVLSLVLKEKIELWISCLAILATDDAEAAEIIERRTRCKAIQLDHTSTETLSQTPSFTYSAKELGLSVPESHIVTSEIEALNAVYPAGPRAGQSKRNLTISSIRQGSPNHNFEAFTPLPTLGKTAERIRKLSPTPFSPFFTQESIPGTEYTTHTLILKGKLTAFVACPSTPNNYTALPYSSALSQAMLLYTGAYISSFGATTGHLSLTFRVPDSVSTIGENTFGVSGSQIQELMSKIYAVSAYPGVSTAVVLFSDESEGLAETYLSILPGHEPLGIANGHRDPYRVITPEPTVLSYYWVGQKLVSGVFGSLFALLRGQVGVRTLWRSWIDVAGILLVYKDATWEVWDP